MTRTNVKSSSLLATLLLIGLGLAVSPARGAESVAQPQPERGAGASGPWDVVVYGGTPGGITAAIAAAREGASVVLLEPTRHVGGMSTSGLNRDEGEHLDRQTLGGLCDRFTREAARRSGTDPDPRGARVWQSRVAEAVFLEMLAEAGVAVRYGARLAGVDKSGPTIRSVRTRNVDAPSRATHAGKVFVDASYEGDLVAAAGVSYALGREARSEFGEPLAGVRYLDAPVPVSPYGEGGALLYGVLPGEPPIEHAATPIPVGYNIRLNLTSDRSTQKPIEEPSDYDASRYELLARCLESGVVKSLREVIGLYPISNSSKVELNNTQRGVVSMGLPTAHQPWAEADPATRDAIHDTFKSYTHGLLWFLKTDPRVPPRVRDKMQPLGLCADEWTDNGGWPWQLYVREARRLRGECVLTQADITDNRDKPDTVHVGSHFIDCHHAARYAVDEGHFVNEGRIWQAGERFDIPYRALTPKRQECDNLLVPVCVSASHVAFCAIRLEPTWMHLGEAAGIAAATAAGAGAAVQEIDVARLQEQLTAAGIPLE
ncbi:FAD-dependent oxidoreductase [Botrimarina sp.]|uniref:FAD-dependent oxidoreductase n=1 Tax=Botrimarina sp. TaxID=2795802 RepID=UPI0032EFC740